MDVLRGNSALVAIVEDNRILRDVLTAHLTEDLICRCTELDGLDDLGRADAAQADLVLLDPTRLTCGPEGALRSTLEIWGGADVVAYVPEAADRLAGRCLRAGYSGVVSRSSQLDTVSLAIETVLAGAIYVDGCFGGAGTGTALGKDDADGLSERETEVLQSFARGHNAKETARRLSISPKTVDTHRQRGMSKLGIAGRSSIVAYALDKDWLA